MKITVWLKKDFEITGERKEFDNVVKVQLLPSGKLCFVSLDPFTGTFIDWFLLPTMYDGFCQWSNDDVLVEEYFKWKDKQGEKK